MTYWELAFYFGYVLPGITTLLLNATFNIEAIRDDFRRRASTATYIPHVTYGTLITDLLIAPALPVINIVCTVIQATEVLDRPVVPRRKSKA